MWMNQLKSCYESFEDSILINTLKWLDAPIPMDGKLKEAVFSLLSSQNQLKNILSALFDIKEDTTMNKTMSANKIKGLCELTTRNGDLTIAQMYSRTLQIIYDPLIDGPLGFVPRIIIPESKNSLNIEYFLLQKQIFRTINQTLKNN